MIYYQDNVNVVGGVQVTILQPPLPRCWWWWCVTTSKTLQIRRQTITDTGITELQGGEGQLQLPRQGDHLY